MPSKLMTQQNNIGRNTALCLFLAVFVAVTCYAPMKTYFWSGGDEAAVYQETAVWCTYCDQTLGRPTLMIGAVLARSLTNDRFDGFLWLDQFCWLVGSVLVFAITRTVTKNSLIGLVAAILYVVSPAESSRYLGVLLHIYTFVQCLLTFAVWLFLKSFTKNSTLLLIVACFILLVDLLMYEAGLPLAMGIPLLLLLLFGPVRSKNLNKRIILWFLAWYGIVIACAARFAVFYFRPASSYQAEYQTGITISFAGLSILSSKLLRLLRPSLNFMYMIAGFKDLARYSLPAFGLFLLVSAVIYFYSRSTGEVLNLAQRRRLATVSLLAIPYLIAALVPFVPITAVFNTFRTQYYALPIQAILWASLIAIISMVPSRSPHPRSILLAVVTGFLVTTAYFSVINLYENGYPFLNYTLYPDMQFGYVKRTFQGIRAIAPRFKPDTFIALILDDPTTTPIAINYGLSRLSAEEFHGILASQINYIGGATFTKDGVVFTDDMDPFVGRNLKFPKVIPYDKVIAFQVSRDGAVRLLERLPTALLPLDIQPDYAPHNLIIDGAPDPLNLLR